ncbi:hypothetical protein [Candidatus Nanohalovita haloferacivicina]|uniref:hypothetical protein n=1 Tax=Candidatus Nanohalovita haloferacivicina TaxID=2978046 RepID=UPI00325F9FB0|nr:hypothetical protein HBNXNv_0388 [Candidatus Nanohalobia archaeon BNXNv]
MKGQFSIEYFGSMVLFLVAVVGLSTIGANQVPNFRDDVHQASLNLEAYTLSSRLMSQPGYHNFDDGGTNWEKNISTIRNTEQVGLANEYRVLQKRKIDQLTTVADDDLNYSIFTDSFNLENDYRMRFTWFPVITTTKSFTRTQSPPEIQEPADFNFGSYDDADNTVHYNTYEFMSTKYCFLTVSHNGVYDTVYKTEYNSSSIYPCEFNTDTVRVGAGGPITLSGYQFRIEEIQNRPDQQGSMFILRRQIRTFGASFDRNARTIKLNRYAVLDAKGEIQPLRIEVWAW